MAKCVDCGFLALRNGRSRELDEAEDLFRRTADVTVDGDYLRHERIPICFARAWNLRMDLPRHLPQDIDEDQRNGRLRNPQPVDLLAMISAERDCGSFTPWQQGFTPKEHRESLDRQELQEWQERQRRDDKCWRIIELILLVIGAGVFTILGAVISRGS